MNQNDRIIIDVMLDGKVQAQHTGYFLPTVGTEFIIGSKSGSKIIRARRVLWGRADHYALCVQVVCDDTGETT